METPDGEMELDNLNEKQYPSKRMNGMIIRGDEIGNKHIELPTIVVNIPEELNAPVNINLVYNIDARTQVVNDERVQNHTEHHTTLAVGDSIVNAIGEMFGKLFE